jgi:soluble lytic murein transglycosylase-like protein
MSTRAMRLLTWGVAIGLVSTLTLSISIRAASAQPTQLLDAAGVMHLTNVPADPRYRDLPTGRGAGAGWLRLPDRSLRAHAEIIDEIARRYGVSPRLVEAIVRVESGFDRAAVSPKGAGGLMQLMPDTAAALGVTDRFDARQNITGGVRHLRYLLDRYQGRVEVALAAYNAGEGVVDTYRGIPPYPETQQYVRRVLGEAGLEGTARGAEQTLYRYQGPDDALIYSNISPPSGNRPPPSPRKERPRRNARGQEG